MLNDELPEPLSASVTVLVKSVSVLPLASCAVTTGSVVKSSCVPDVRLNGEGCVVNANLVATTSAVRLFDVALVTPLADAVSPNVCWSVVAGRRPVEASETLDPAALALETLMTGLRTYAGVDLERLRSRWSMDLVAGNRELVKRLDSQGLASVEGGRLGPTLDGLAVADSVASSFELPACSSRM